MLQVRKALDMLKKLADASAKAKRRIAKHDGDDDAAAAAESDDESDDESDAPFDREALQKDIDKYETVWTEFGRALKLGAPSLCWHAVCRTHFWLCLAPCAWHGVMRDTGFAARVHHA